jgi:hypothetical protein
MTTRTIDRPFAPALKAEIENILAELEAKESYTRQLRELGLTEEQIADEKLAQAIFKAHGGSFPMMGGAAGAWTFTNNTRTYILNALFDMDSDTFKVALFLSTSNLGAATTTYAGVTNEHSAANGYSTGGVAVTLTMSGTTSVAVVASANPTFTASGGSIVARFAALYEVSGNVFAYCLLDSTPADVTTTTGNSLAIGMTSSAYTLA